MDNALVVPAPEVGGFVVHIASQMSKMTATEIDAAAKLYRGCGTLKRYIALAVSREFSRDTVDDRARFAKACRDYLGDDARYVMKQAVVAELEVEIFGPLTSDSDRMMKSIPIEDGLTIAALPTAEIRAEVYAKWTDPLFLKSSLGTIINIVKKGVEAIPPATQEFRDYATDVEAETPITAGAPPDAATAPETSDTTEKAPQVVSGEKARKIKPKPAPGTTKLKVDPDSEEALQTALTWVQNEAMDGDRTLRNVVSAALYKLSLRIAGEKIK